MNNEWDQPVEARRPRRWPWLLLAFLVAFVAGVAATVYTLRRSQPARHLAGLDPTVVAPASVPQAAPVARAPAPSPAVTIDLTRRVERTERDLLALAERTTQTSSNADRAEGLLIAFAARRALDRGAQLGYIEGLMRERFGAGQPQAVATIISASHQPVTLDELQSGLDGIAPTLLARGTGDSWWQGVRRELSGLIVVRRASVPSIAPVDRLTRARRQLESGHVAQALAEIARLPGRALATEWIAQARRYVSARSALDMIETAALLAPHQASLPEVPPVPAAASPRPSPALPPVATASAAATAPKIR